ncbi:methyltransferase type 11 [Corynascus similis CBS 632.67]
MEHDPKEIVKQTYDQLASWYLNWVDGQRSPRERYAIKVLQNAWSTALLSSSPASQATKTVASPTPPQVLPPPRILDLGCGPGVSVTRMLLERGAHVVANDISAQQLAMARSRCSGDMAGLTFEPDSFDGAVSFFALFHLPRTEQRAVLAKVRTWLRPGALFAFNLATIDEEAIYGEMMGRGMFWSSYSVDESCAMVRDAELDLVAAEVLESEPDDGVEFLWVVAAVPRKQRSE